MANILELLKNEEVEWKKLGEIADIQRGRIYWILPFMIL